MSDDIVTVNLHVTSAPKLNYVLLVDASPEEIICASENVSSWTFVFTFLTFPPEEIEDKIEDYNVLKTHKNADRIMQPVYVGNFASIPDAIDKVIGAWQADGIFELERVELPISRGFCVSAG